MLLWSDAFGAYTTIRLPTFRNLILSLQRFFVDDFGEALIMHELDDLESS